MHHTAILSGASGHYGRALAVALAALPPTSAVRPSSLALLGRRADALAATAAAVAAADAGQPPLAVSTHSVDLVTAAAAADASGGGGGGGGGGVGGANDDGGLAAALAVVAPPPPTRVTLIAASGAVCVGAPLTVSVAVNAAAPLALAAAVVAATPPQTPLTVVHVSSLLAIAPTELPALVPYAVGKAAAEAGFRCMAAAAAAAGRVRVLNWAPGPLAAGGMRDHLRAAGVVDRVPPAAEVGVADSAAALMGLLEAGGWASGDHVDYYDVVGRGGR